jgi:hypothetical protein
MFPTVIRLRPALLVCLALFVVGAFASASAVVPQVKDKTKVSSLAACPPWGAEQRGSPHGLLNEVKRHVPNGTTPTLLDFSDVLSLQQQSDARVRTGKDSPITATERAKLRGFAIGDRRAGEGDLVAMVGFVAGKPESNLGESVNCYLHGPDNNDFHIALVRTPHAPRRDGIVAEMIPQDRPKGWTLNRLRKLAGDGRQVLVIGQLSLDSIHQLNEEERASIWEIHPVTKFLVCRRVENDCSPNRDEDWQALESVPDR